MAARLLLGDVAAVRARIFGARIGDGTRSGWKVLKSVPRGERIADYYLPNLESRVPGYVEPYKETQRMINDRRARRGKPPTRKGQGKKAKKRAKHL